MLKNKVLTNGEIGVALLVFLIAEAIGSFITVYNVAADNYEINVGRGICNSNNLFKIILNVFVALCVNCFNRLVTVAFFIAVVKNLRAVVNIG